MIVAALAPEYHPLLQPVFGVLAAVSAHLHHLVLAESLFLGQSHHGSQVLLLLPLGVQHVAVPLSDLRHYALVAQLVQIQPIVAEGLAVIEFLLIAQSSQVKLDAHFGDDFVVELCPHPHAKLGPGRQDAESLGDISDRPSLQVKLVDGVNSPRGKGSIQVFLSVVWVDSLDYSSVGMRLLASGEVIIVDGFFELHLISMMNPLLLIQFRNLVLSVVELPLEEVAVLGETHVGVLVGQGLHLVLEGGLLHVVVGQLVDELVEILSAVLVSQVLVLPQVAVL